jgi:hypothetical protein
MATCESKMLYTVTGNDGTSTQTQASHFKFRVK